MLMQATMHRLEKEFYQIFFTNCDHLNLKSIFARSWGSSISGTEEDVSGLPKDDICEARESIREVELAIIVVVADLHVMTKTMISAGYGKNAFKLTRSYIRGHLLVFLLETRDGDPHGRGVLYLHETQMV